MPGTGSGTRNMDTCNFISKSHKSFTSERLKKVTIAFSIQCKYKCSFFLFLGKMKVTLKSICEQWAFKVRARLCFCKRVLYEILQVYHSQVQETYFELLGQMMLLRGKEHFFPL